MPPVVLLPARAIRPVNPMNTKGLVFDIQSFSVHDGPGCRTTVFMAGCPLQCGWCANPESWVRKKQLLFAAKVCKWAKGCRACENACPRGSIQFPAEGEPIISWEICRTCENFDCVALCPNQALKQCGREVTVEELTAILRRDFNHWGADGGVTFSGGEPLLQPEFLLAVLQQCHALQIGTAMETSAYAQADVFLAIMQYIQFAFIDVKHMDREQHKAGTGVDNDRILANIALLRQSGWPGRLVLRQPVIKGYNDSAENARQLIAFMNKHDLYELNLLRFHKLGMTKWNQLGKEYAYRDQGDVTDKKLAQLQELYLDHQIACYIGDHTPF